MSDDLHMRILRLVAHRTQGEFDDYDAVDRAVDSASSDRRRHLKGIAVRDRLRLAAAQARRRQ